MIKTGLIAGLISLALTILCGFLFIPFLRKIKAGQPVLKYVKEHKGKEGTPTMGGLFFIIPTAVIFFIFGGTNGRTALVALSVGLAFMIVGFVDDYIKVKSGHNEGLKPYQKILFQLAIASVAGAFCYVNRITEYYIPLTTYKVDLGVFTIPLSAFIFIATTNCVNLTDGLDGLAGGVSGIYLLLLSFIISAEVTFFSGGALTTEEYGYMELLSFILAFSIFGFLVFNVNKAKVFMGDTGSLSLGGFIAGLSVFSSNGFLVAVAGITSVFSGISVIIQVAHYKRTKRRVFLMAPFHHHLQLRGFSESRISYVYALITAVLGIISLLCFL